MTNSESSIIKKLVGQTSSYMSGEVLILLGGFISFPIFSRILTKEEYGVMSLISITLSLVEAFASGGLRHAAIRFYPRYDQEKKTGEFYATTLINSMLFGMAGTIFIIITASLLAWGGLIEDKINTSFVLASTLIFIRVATKMLGCIFRVREMARTYSLFAVLTKYVSMGASILLVVHYTLGVNGFFSGLVIGELLVLLAFAAMLFPEMREFAKTENSYPMLREMVIYGFPLVLAGFSSAILMMGDRYVIGYFMTAKDVADYSVPYNLCSYITGTIVTSFEFALVPMMVREWHKPGHGNFHAGLQMTIRVYLLVALPILFGVTSLGEEFITLLASDKYSGASRILPYILAGEILRGLYPPLMIGLQLHNRTGEVAKLTLYAAIFNILLNIILVPFFGLTGSAVATLVCYVFLMVIGTVISFKYLNTAPSMPWMHLMKYTGCAYIMFLFIRTFQAYGTQNIAAATAAGVLVYAILIIIADKEVRRFSLSFAGRLK